VIFLTGTGGVGFAVAASSKLTLIQSGSSVGSNGFLGRFGLRTHPSPGGFGISTFEAALLSNHHFLLSEDGGGTYIVSPRPGRGKYIPSCRHPTPPDFHR
jgi:hypothetical protein